jgi:hypothetical protein
MSKNHRTVVLGLCASALIALNSGVARAVTVATTFNGESSSIVYTHIDDISNEANNSFSTTVAGASIPAAAPAGAGFQFTHTFTTTTRTGNSSTTSDATVYEITNLTNLSVALKGGTGVTQTNVPGKAYNGASNLDIAVDAVWNLGTAGFTSIGTLPALDYSFPLGGIVGIGGSDQFNVNLDVIESFPLDPVLGPVTIGTISTGQTFSNPGGAAKSFLSNLSGSILINNGLHIPGGAEITIQGNIDFYATNDESPSSFNLTSDSSIGLGSFTAPLPASGCMALAGVVGLFVLRRSKALVFRA